MSNKGMIGVQMMMLKGKVDELGVYEVFKRVSEMGFACVEVSQIDMTAENVKEMKRAMDDFGIKIASLSVAVEPMFPGMPGEYLNTEEGFNKIVNDCKTLNCSLVRIGMMPMNLMGNREGVLEFVKRADGYAEALAKHGIDLYYHNHHIEFQKIDGQCLIDIIKDTTKYMGFEFDVHWIHRGGYNPVEVLNNYKGRVKLLHLKDYKIGQFVQPEGPFDLKKFMMAFTSIVEFAELGEGSLDFDAIIKAGLNSGSEYFLIEQDDTYGRDPFTCLETSKKHLVKIGYGSWFK